METVMKIGSSPDKAAAPAAASTTNRAKTAGASSAEGSAKDDASAQVKLSDAASSLMSTSTSSKGDFDAEKVNRIAQAIADGKFEVNHAAIADKLISNAQELLKSPH
jgi:negative regulator of flagellin synthesis FlgM